MFERFERYSNRTSNRVEPRTVRYRFGPNRNTKVYLLGRKFVVQTDHRALEWMERLKENSARLCSLALQPYSFVVEHCPEAQNLNADALSRNPAMAGEGGGRVRAQTYGHAH